MSGRNGNGNGNINGTSIITPLLSAASLILALGVAFWTNSKGDVSSVKYELREDVRLAEERQNREIAAVRAEIAGIRDIISNKVLFTTEHREFKEKTDKGIDQNNMDIRNIRAEIVPRAEHTQHWNDFGDRLNALRDALTDERKSRADEVAVLRKDFGGTYTLGDVVKQLQDQIKQLQIQISNLPRSGGPPAVFPPATNHNGT